MSRFVLIGIVCLLTCALLGGCAQPSAPADDSQQTESSVTFFPSASTTATTATTGASATVAPVTIAAETVVAKEGDTVLLPIVVSEGTQLVNADLYLRYDPEKLRVVEQYDAASDAYVIAKAGIWEGTIYASETEAGTLRIMLADGGDGIARRGNLFTVAFEVTSLPDEGVSVALDVPVCGVCPDGVNDVDVVKEKLLTVKSGGITPNAE